MPLKDANASRELPLCYPTTGTCDGNAARVQNEVEGCLVLCAETPRLLLVFSPPQYNGSTALGEVEGHSRFRAVIQRRALVRAVPSALPSRTLLE